MANKPTKKELARHKIWQLHIDKHYYYKKDWEASDDYNIWEDGGMPPKTEKNKRGVESVDMFA
jgi:hypothetical protein